MTIALWCVLAAAILPILCTGLAKVLGGRYDNHDPRAHALRYEGMARRAYAAHQNGFEAFPLFAAAVLVAELKGGSQGLVDGLAFAFIVLRTGYVGAYLTDRPRLRSTFWALAFFAKIAIFVSPLWR